MAGFRKFEDIIAWQKAREANKLIYKHTAENNFSRDFELRNQIRRDFRLFSRSHLGR
ncbi:MAG: four helix bundle protein [Saprospiraceae bacterium]|nr:four helix bundle protein [Pyrinomonadaceae bacterium]